MFPNAISHPATSDQFVGGEIDVFSAGYLRALVGFLECGKRLVGSEKDPAIIVFDVGIVDQFEMWGVRG